MRNFYETAEKQLTNDMEADIMTRHSEMNAGVLE